MDDSITSKPHIIVRLMGGLGNQLFIYAFAKTMSLKNDVGLKLDTISGFVQDKSYKRQYLLGNLAIDDEVASPMESYQHLWGEKRRGLIKKLNALLPLKRKNYIKERKRGFDPDIFHLPIRRTVYFDGYWQSYKYFQDVGDLIRHKLSFSFPITPEITQEAEMIRSCNSVCIGIRRYEEMPEERRRNRLVLGVDYYRRAMDIIQQAIPDPYFFIFTQDRLWAHQNLTFESSRNIMVKERDTNLGVLVDMWLMSQCKHFVISNSTLYWWGAWLGQNPDKLVIAPQDGWGRQGIVPSHWTTLKVN
jgi:hypothetical protein